MVNPLLLTAFAVSKGIKSKRDREKAVKAAELEQQAKTAITNVIKMADGRVANLKAGENLPVGSEIMGFFRGNSDQLIEIPKDERLANQLFVNPANESGPLITRKQFNVINKDNAYTIGPVVASLDSQGKPVYVSGFKHPTLRETTSKQYGTKVKNVFVPLAEDDTTTTATHSRKVTRNFKNEIIKTEDEKSIIDDNVVYLVKNLQDDKVTEVPKQQAYQMVNSKKGVILGIRKIGTATVSNFNAINQKKDMDSVIRDDKITSIINFSKGRNLTTNKLSKDPDPMVFFKNQDGFGNLAEFNRRLESEEGLLSQINNNRNLLNEVSSVLTTQLASFFKGKPVGLDAEGAVIMSEQQVMDKADAVRKVRNFFKGIANIKGIENIAAIAADVEDRKISEFVLKNGVSENEIPVGVIKMPTNMGLVYTTQGVPKKYKETINTVQQVMGEIKDSNQIGRNIEKLIVYKTDDKGEPLRTLTKDGKGLRLIPADNQPPLDFVAELSKTRLGGGVKVGNRFATEFDGFLSLIHPSSKNHPVGTLNTQVEASIKRKFAELVDYDIDKAMNLISAFSGNESRETISIMNQLYGGNIITNKKLRQDIRAKAGSAENALLTVSSMKATYFTEDGVPIDIGSRQGEIFVTVTGAIQSAVRYGKGAVSLFKGGTVYDLATASDNQLAENLQDPTLKYDSVGAFFGKTKKGDDATIISNEEIMKKENEAAQRNKARFENVKKYLSGAKDIDSFVKNLDRDTRQALKGEKSAEVIRKLAMRQYHKFMLAYQLAAAIQGGTGGRTISDQDVENILRALNFGFFTPASVELAVLETAEDMLQTIYKYNNALLSSDVNKVHAGLKTRQMLKDQKSGALFRKVYSSRAFVNAQLRGAMKRFAGPLPKGVSATYETATEEEQRGFDFMERNLKGL